ncbi:hypothetical protein HBH56_139720 [Parastagonospora nodorum]|uniref:Uncharacterized protein n=1 Tax=Phaeosphaeria nodorum (strain SN15 / ATCC MYA-4574 / FGSC 10173) TaxID=321614 RepID=A0A7U2EUY3_PHANO|nr:hypothetical protein HBH56_139720 [Parastagonospora nodorum]QRC91505.1 hypothetical protein JI435_010070 [Parastagonospora nodorum SN15]KAH3928201.1 hypothetical protein HBH54_144860 [Parastagonospora nodorum]KAH3983525.1 hypothetical protein HBH51_033300 [Parastagonospora nodorum]KAH4041573.1 hypothetical protein HBI09_001690 [Parastagonospora nodorum]
MFSQNSFLPSGAMFDQGFAFNSSLDMSPHPMPEPAGSWHMNNRLAYAGSSSYGFPSTGSTKYRDAHAWCPMRSTEVVPRGFSMNGSDSETNSSYSPKSFVSETQSETMPFTPEPASEITNWSSYGSQTRPAIKASSPESPVVVTEEDAANFSGPSRYAMGDIVHSPTSAEITHCLNGLPTVGNDTRRLYDSEYAYSQASSPGLSPWYAEGESGMAMPFRPRNPPITSAPSSFSTAYQNENANSASRGNPSWAGPQTNFPIQDRAQSHRVVDSHTQRKADDQILLEGKKDGLTYKEIRKRMYTKCAESTLRGRYRSLTKARQDRVRKPVWQKKDVSRDMHDAHFIADMREARPSQDVCSTRPRSHQFELP